MPTRDEDDQRLMVDRHLNALSNLRIAREAKHWVFIPENMTGLEHSHLSNMVLRRHRNVEVYADKPGKLGVCKDAYVTRQYQFMLTNSLMSNLIHFSRDLFTTTPEMSPKSMLTMLEDQALRLRWEKRKGNTIFQDDKVKLTAKQGNKQDDLLIAVVMVMYWGRLYAEQRS